MTIGHSKGTLFELQIRSGLRLGLTLIITLMVISSPIFILVNPAYAAPSSSTDGSPSAPSTIGQDGSDFTTQAALGSVTARPTNNIVTTTSFYDIVFVTATAGAIKTIEVTFPAGTQMPATPLLNEVEGIGPGTASRSGQTIIYTVANAVNVPAGTRIRLEVANINNPVNPSTSYTVSVTTKNAANDPIDGPTPSTAYTMKQIGASIIAPGSITNTRIADDAVTTPKIADGAVTGSKIQGTQKLLFAECQLPADNSIFPGGESTFVSCSVPGTEIGDDVLALYLGVGKSSFVPNLSVHAGFAATDEVQLFVRNDNASPVLTNDQVFSIIVFKK